MARIAVGTCSSCGKELRVKAQAVKALMHLTCKCGATNTVRPSAALLQQSEAVASSPQHEVASLIKRLDSKNPIVAGCDGQAAQQLRDIGDPAVPYLIPVLKGEKKGNRGAVATILGRISDDRCIAALLEVLGDERESEEVRSAAAGAIGESTADPALTVPILADALRDTRFSVRYSAIIALREIGQHARSAVSRLLELSNDPDRRIRSLVSGAIAKIDPTTRSLHHQNLEAARGPDSLDDMIDQLKDRTSDIRIQASNSMCQLPDIGDFYFRAVDPLVQALKDPEAEVRANAAYALANIADGRAVAPLIDCIREPDVAIVDAASTVHEYVALALGNIGDARAIAPLVEALQQDESSSSRGSIVRALGKLRATSALPDLEQVARSDEDAIVRSAAQEVIEDISGSPLTTSGARSQKQTDKSKTRQRKRTSLAYKAGQYYAKHPIVCLMALIIIAVLIMVLLIYGSQ